VEAIEQQFPAVEMERMMKAQEVIMKAAAGKLKWWEAAEIMGITDRTMRRWRERMKEHGYSGLWDYRKRGPSPKRVPMETVEKVLQLYQERYFDFNVRHFHEKLRNEHGIRLSYTWVKTALQTAGLVKRRKKPGSHRKRRPRRALPGMMLHIDASEHRWFGDQRRDELGALALALEEAHAQRMVVARRRHLRGRGRLGRVIGATTGGEDEGGDCERTDHEGLLGGLLLELGLRRAP